MKRVRDSFNSYPVDTLALELATLAVRDRSWYEENRRRILKTRAGSAAALSAMGWDVLDTSANFLFAKPAGISAGELYKKLRAAGILVRYFDKPRIREYLRISVGTDEEMNTLLSAIENILQRRNEDSI